MNSSQKVLDLPNSRLFNIDARVWVWIILGWFVALTIHVLAFSRGHFIAQSKGQFLLLSPSGLRTASETNLSDNLLPEYNSFNATSSLPASYNIWLQDFARPVTNLVLDQGPYGSCTANALAYAWLLHMNKLNTGRVPVQIPSRMFWYAQARIYLNNQNGHSSAKLQDTGAYVSDIAWVPETLGSLPEVLYPYTAANLNAIPNVLVPPCDEAIKHKMSTDTLNPFQFSNNALITAQNIMAILASNKCLLIGILMYSSFMNSTTLRTGVIPLPNTRTETLLGGHCICLTGYNSITQYFTFKNSWGSEVGMAGTFFIPYAYICNIYLTGDAQVF